MTDGLFRLLSASVLLSAFTCSLTAGNNYLVHNLVSDIAGLADHQDANLVNPWGIASSTSGAFWIGNNGSGTSTLYDGAGTASPLIVAIPGPGGAATGGAVTGVVFNSSQGLFNVAPGKQAAFVFCSEDGVISGWNSTVDMTHAQIMIDNSQSGAVYKGCTIGGSTGAPLLYAANFNSGNIDVWDGNLNRVLAAGVFLNNAVPAGFAPFDILNLGGKLYVTYAKQDGDKHDDVAGAGNGYVAVFDMSGNLIRNLASGGLLNSPWGLTIAPSTFGPFANTLLVGNFGDGTIHAFDSVTGALQGTLDDLQGNTITIPGLWSLAFGNGHASDSSLLYFTAGIGAGGELESHGLYGSIEGAPNIQSSS